MKVNEIFKSIQGEGRYVGHPALFIRLSGCNLNCPWCDTKYHRKGKEMLVDEVIEKIEQARKEKTKNVVWTGGEPLLQREGIYRIIEKTQGYMIHIIETNGTLLKNSDFTVFDYLVLSPKDKETAKKVRTLRRKYMKFNNDIKIVTDLETVGVELIPYATMLMPLTTFNKKKDLEIKRKVWKYCVEHGLKYSPRIHIDVWGKRRGV